MRISSPMNVGALVALVLCVPQLARAQSAPGGRIEGVVYDSVHARPLANANVAAAGTGSQSEVRRGATTDSAGRYHIDSLPAGRYVVGFESPLLDSLEVTQSPREAIVPPGGAATLDLALPSAAKLRSAVCLGAALPADSGVIIGHVVDAETGDPLAGADIALAWQDLHVEKGKRLRTVNVRQSASVVTDDDGWYRMCGVPTGAWVTMQVQHDSSSSPVFRTRVDDTLRIAIRHLSLGGGSGTASLAGIVSGPGGAPVASAEVWVRGTNSNARTDATGSYTLSALPGGTQELEVRRIGYALEVVPVELRSGTKTTADVHLRRVVNLDSVVVVATRTKYPDFYAHKSSGFGRFLGPEEIGMQRVATTSDIIQKIPGFMVRRHGYHTVVEAMGGSANGCPVTVVIDGMRLLEYPPTVDFVHPLDIAAIEAYPASMAAQAPMEYNIGSCGGIVIWTKR
ncbi:MAG TPA: carboxypeptidase-like regulatory domain-containing protein [Gemmatimonadaceae bacterium]